MTNRINIRTLNGKKHNPLLPPKFQRIQNRAAAVWDAWDEFGSGMSLDVVAHLHKLSPQQIQYDMYGNPLDIDKRFGIEDSTKLEHALHICLQEIEEGIDQTLVAVANHVPFCLIRQIEDVRDIKIVANDFLRDMSNKLVEIQKKQRQQHFELIDRMITSTTTISSTLPLQSIENCLSTYQPATCKQSETTTNIDLNHSSCSDEPFSTPTQTIKTSKKRSNTDTITTTSPPNIAHLYQLQSQNHILVQSENVAGSAQVHQLDNDSQSPIVLINDKPSAHKHSIRSYHRASLSSLSNLMNWTVVNQHGLGLDNHGRMKHQQNKCYLNAIIQCLANTAPFAQWLLCDAKDDQCQLKNDRRLCSVCELRSIFIAIYMYSNHNSYCDVFATLSQATADSLARRINEISSTFVIGRQEDPSELFTTLLYHLTECLSPINYTLNTNSSSTVIQDIFGIQFESLVECSKCRNTTLNEALEEMWSIPIDSQTTLLQSITEFCKRELLCGNNAYQCSKCAEKVEATRSYKLIKASPIITIHLKRFMYDEQTGTTEKIKKFITFPELLDLTPYFNETILESMRANKEENNILIYELYAVVVHLGEKPTEGHVYAYVRSPDGLWYKTNDNSVTQVDIKQVLTNENAYMLFYSKVSEDRSILNRTTFETNTTPSSVSSFSFSNLSTLKTKSNSETTNHQYLTTCFTKEISCINDSEIRMSAKESISSNEQPMMSRIEISSKDSSTQQVHSQTSSQLLNKNLRLRTSSISNSQIEYGRDVNDNEEVYDKYSSINENVSLIDISNNSPVNNITILSSISYQQHSPLLVTVNDSPDNRSNTSQYHKSTSMQSNVSLTNSVSDDDFVAELPNSYQFKLQGADRTKLQQIRATKIKNRRNRLFEQMGLPLEEEIARPKKIFLSKNKQLKNMSDKILDNTDLVKSTKSPKVDVEYFYVLYPYIKQMNPYCGLCIRNCTFGVQTNELQQLLRCDLRCAGRPTCPFRCSIIIRNDGFGYVIVNNNNVRHKRNSKICRPIRAPQRSLLKQQFIDGASLYRMYRNRLQSRSIEEQKGRNYDIVGKSRGVLQKIKSESTLESLLSPNADDGLLKLNEHYRREVNAGGKVEGAIQLISRFPCQIVVYSETSIRLYDSLLKHKNITVSWDATGGIIKQSNSLKLLYYELSITLPGVVTEDSIIPITFMISSAHALVDVLHWMQLFRHSYCQVFPGQDFPRPSIVLSDRAQVFLMAALQIWNGETLNNFLDRAYRIVTNKATEIDYKLTNIHACLSHILLGSRKRINKLLDEKIRSLAMWCIALLINTSSWDEMMHNWKLICYVFVQLHVGDENINNEYHDALLNKISKIKSDPNTCAVIQSTELKSSESTTNRDPFDYDDSDDDIEHHGRFSMPIHQNTSTKKKNEEVIIDEEAEMNATDSPFKAILNQIFDNCLKDIGISVDEAQKPARHGILRWFKYLTTSFLPTIPVWSNLLLGDLSRHRRRLVKSFESLIIQSSEQRTTATSERRMGILKRAQLGGTIHIRLDVLLSILVPDMLSMIQEFSTALHSYTASSVEEININNDLTVLKEKRMKPVQEHWNKPNNKRNSGRYAKPPDELTLTELMSILIAPTDNVNANLQLPIVTPNWINTAIGLLLSTQTYGTYYNRPPVLSSDVPIVVDLIRSFIDEWSISTVQNNKFSTMTFNIPAQDEPKELDQQSLYILERILIPLLDSKIICHKVYVCQSCKGEVKIRATFTYIPVHVNKTGLHIERDLLTFFGPMTSDILCSACGKPTIRHIEVEKWPQVLIINVIDSKATCQYRKPPGVISLCQFSDWLAIGTPSSALYDLITFNSVLHVGEKENMVRVTKSKTNWITSINKKRIGNGEQLRRLYGFSRILIFERIFHETKFDMIRAIARCVFDAPSYQLPDTPICITLQEACSIIESNPDLNALKNLIISTIDTYFYCYSCHKILDSLISSHNQVYIFKLTDKNEIVAHPVVYKENEDLVDDEKPCTYCKYSTKNINLPVHKQVFHKCPDILLKLINRNMAPNDIFDSQVKLIDSTGAQFTYTTAAILIISRYSNIMSVVKRKENQYITYNDHLYTDFVYLSTAKLADLLDTSMSIIGFYSCNRTTPTPSSVQIISRDLVNGNHRLMVRNGNQFFVVTCGEPNTTNDHN